MAMVVLLKRVIEKLKYLTHKPKEVFLLEMLFPTTEKVEISEPTIGSDYILRTFDVDQDFEKYSQLLLNTEMGVCPLESYWYDHILPDGFFVVEHLKTKEIVGACFASHHPSKRHPFAGNLGWLAVDSTHRGNNIGKALVLAVVKRLKKSGYKRIYLETHDFRIPAIALYFKTGWVPYLYNEEVTTRWKKVVDTLKLAYEPEKWVQN